MPTTYAIPQGTNAGLKYYMDIALTPANIKNGELRERLDPVVYPQKGRQKDLTLSVATGLAAGGTATVITGKNFTGATGVTFGGTAGTAFSVVNDSTINVTSPAKAAGTYDVVVTRPVASLTKVGGFVYT